MNLLSEKNPEWIEMKNLENIENTIVLNDENILIEIEGTSYSLNELKGFIDSCKELSEKLGQVENENLLRIEESNKLFCEKMDLQQDNKVLKEELTYFKKYAEEIERKLNNKSYMVEGLKTSNRLLTIERNGLQSTIDQMRSNVGYDSFIEAELAAEQHEAETVSALGSFLGDDF